MMFYGQIFPKLGYTSKYIFLWRRTIHKFLPFCRCRLPGVVMWRVAASCTGRPVPRHPRTPRTGPRNWTFASGNWHSRWRTAWNCWTKWWGRLRLGRSTCCSRKSWKLGTAGRRSRSIPCQRQTKSEIVPSWAQANKICWTAHFFFDRFSQQTCQRIEHFLDTDVNAFSTWVSIMPLQGPVLQLFRGCSVKCTSKQSLYLFSIH